MKKLLTLVSLTLLSGSAFAKAAEPTFTVVCHMKNSESISQDFILSYDNGLSISSTTTTKGIVQTTVRGLFLHNSRLNVEYPGAKVISASAQDDIWGTVEYVKEDGKAQISVSLREEPASANTNGLVPCE